MILAFPSSTISSVESRTKDSGFSQSWESNNWPEASLVKNRSSFNLKGSELKMLKPFEETATKQPKSWLKFANTKPQFDSQADRSIL